MSSSRIVVVSGASRGIGKAVCRKFHEAGDIVVGCGSKPASKAHIEADLALTCDVTRPDEVKAFVRDIVAKYGRIDVLVNNAGLAGQNSLAPGSDDDLWHSILNVNLNGTYYLSKHSLPHMTNHTGRIINIASVLALKGVPDSTAYCAAKHAVLGFTRALAHQIAPRKITVNAVCPGWTRTDMARDRMLEIGLTEADFRHSVPLGRFIEPNEVADLVFFSASPAAAGITGQALSIDGGVSA